MISVSLSKSGLGSITIEGSQFKNGFELKIITNNNKYILYIIFLNCNYFSVYREVIAKLVFVLLYENLLPELTAFHFKLTQTLLKIFPTLGAPDSSLSNHTSEKMSKQTIKRIRKEVPGVDS